MSSWPVCHALGIVWRNPQNQVFLLRSAQFVVLRPALEDLWFLSCCFFYKYIQEIFFCKVDQKMSLVVVLRQEAASRYFCLAYWRAERETGCLRHMQPPPPSVCLGCQRLVHHLGIVFLLSSMDYSRNITLRYQKGGNNLFVICITYLFKKQFYWFDICLIICNPVRRIMMNLSLP